MIVPCRFVQEEDVPVRGDEHEAGEAVETAKHDAQGAFRAKHKHTTSVNKNNNCCYYELDYTLKISFVIQYAKKRSYRSTSF